MMNCVLDSNDYVLPKGTTCVIPPIATHHCEELYPNSWAFNPDNFNPENVANRHRYSFIAFSGGPRGCIGKILMFIIVFEHVAKIFTTKDRDYLAPNFSSVLYHHK